MRALSAALLASLVWTTGCVGYHVTPEKPTETPRAQRQRPLRVGVSLKQSYEWKGFGINNRAMDRWRSWSRFKPMFHEVDHVGDSFVKALDDSHGFSSVYILPGDSFGAAEFASHDLVIDAHIKGTYQQDPAQFGKAFMTGFLLLLPAPFVRYDDTFTTAADLSLYDASGRLVRNITDSQSAESSAALFSAGQPSEIIAGVQSSAQNLAAKLVQAILSDGAMLDALGKRDVAGRAAAKPAEPDPEVAAAVAEAERAAAKVAALKAARAASAAAPAASEAPAAAAPAPAVEQVSAPAPAPAPASQDLAEGPSRPTLPKRGQRVRISNSEAAAELLP